ncbi:hypothetical protein [Cohnella silvisoli]|uniref:DUF4179 domain-containing protein n=1 Tax=Cohnella silvisoli TaxID=2873699 RepID=A0ABV1L5H2_9BACL|nr:hypothetical protein [Cohnella silvisoli]MCD9026428.1 hypothetical protein [Cohnella silvisoli]
MKIKISEMFEDAFVNTDAIQLKEDLSIDKDRVRQLVMSKINCQQAGTDKLPPKTKRISAKITLIAAAIIALLMSAVAVNAASGGKLFGAMLLNNENRHIAKEPNYASMEEVPAGTVIETSERRVLISDIINKDKLHTLNAGSVTNIAAAENNGKYAIPELLTNNGDLVVFTKVDESGWHLNKGDKLSIRFALDIKTNKYSDRTGERMEIGYIKNGVLITGFVKKEKEFSYTITADEAGEYYFYAENYSASYIIIQSGIIN